jgi:hypothetical protein
VPASHLLDALVFAAGGVAFAEVWVAGQRVRHTPANPAFKAAMQTLWA